MEYRFVEDAANCEYEIDLRILIKDFLKEIVESALYSSCEMLFSRMGLKEDDFEIFKDSFMEEDIEEQSAYLRHWSCAAVG